MKFACIETGGNIDGIVRTNKALNTELVPNGWYAWTAALGGEHMSLEPFLAFHQLPHVCKAILRRILQGKTFFSNLSYLKRFDVLLVVFRDYSLSATMQFLFAARKFAKNTIFIVARSHPFGRFQDAWRQEEKSFQLFYDILNTCDIYFEVNRHCLPYSRQITTTPVVYLPPSYPCHFFKDSFLERESKSKTLMVTGDAGRPDAVANLLIAKGIQEKCPDILIQVPETKGRNLSILKGCRYEVIRRVPWDKFIDILRKTYVVLNWDTWWTLGRMPGDAAALGTACIGSNADLQSLLFPTLTFDDVSGIENAINMGIQLFTDAELYENIRLNAKNRLEICSFENSRLRFEKLITEYKNGKLGYQDITTY